MASMRRDGPNARDETHLTGFGAMVSRLTLVVFRIRVAVGAEGASSGAVNGGRERK
jgi:hypothetical protein